MKNTKIILTTAFLMDLTTCGNNASQNNEIVDKATNQNEVS